MFQPIAQFRVKQRIKEELKDVRDTTTMVKKFVYLLSLCGPQNVDSYLLGFKELYSKAPYYQDVKHSIIDKVELVGIDVYHAEHFL